MSTSAYDRELMFVCRDSILRSGSAQLKLGCYWPVVRKLLSLINVGSTLYFCINILPYVSCNGVAVKDVVVTAVRGIATLEMATG
jgi:hypothetical protein